MKYLNFKEIKHITLISSESCNLNCSYCELAKSVSIYYDKEQSKKVKENISSGEFLKNIKKIINKFNIDPKQITGFDLWGQEPTLTLNEISGMLPSFFDFFPNLMYSMFSSNMVQYPDRIINYIKTIEDICRQQNKENFKINIQCSFDGYENTKKFRGIDPEIILNNVEYLIKELNNLKLNHSFININFNNVITKEEVLDLNSYNKVKNYWEELYNITNNYIVLNTNPNVCIYKHFGCGPETPVNATKEQGMAFANFLQLSQRVNKDFAYLDNYKRAMERIYKNNYLFNTIYNESKKDWIDFLPSCDINSKLINNLTRSIYCSPGIGSFKIRYDGSLVHCHHSIHHTSLSSFEKKKGWKYDNLKNFASHNYYPNAANDSLNDLNQYFYKIKTTLSSSILHTYSLVVKLMHYLVKCNQISEYYNNEINILRHAFLVTKITCLDANFHNLGSGAGTWIGVIRFYCNGVFEFIENNQEMLKEFSKEKKW